MAMQIAYYTAHFSCRAMPSSPASVLFDIDPVAAVRWQRQQPHASPWLHEEVAQRMLQRLDAIMLQPGQWLHWQPAQGGLKAHEALLRRYPQARAWQMPGASQPAPSSIDMLWANMVLDKTADPRDVLAQWRRLLSPDGFVMFSVLGPGSLPQLRSLYQSLGWMPPCHAFTDIHDWGDMLHQAGFSDVVMDAECVTLTFATPQRLLQELREMGHNLSSGRSRTTHTRSWLQKWHEAVQTLALPDGQLPLTFEIIYGHAVQSTQDRDEAGDVTVDLAQMRRMLLGKG